MGLFEHFEAEQEVDEGPGTAHALKAIEAYNAEAERQRALPVPPVRQDTPTGLRLAEMANQPPELDAERQALFLEHYHRVPNYALAALRAGVLVSTVDKLRRESPEFDIAVRMARDVALGVAEEEAWRRAVRGIDKPVYHNGARIDVLKEYDSGLLTRIMEAGLPAYERKTKLEGSLQIAHSWLDMVRARTQEKIGS